MAIFRVNKTKDYTVMSNYHLRDKNLSLKAKGLLSVMLSLPDNWDYSKDGLIAICKENRTLVESALDELKKNKYLVIKEERDKKGRFAYIYDIYEKPYIELPHTEKPYTELPCTENQQQLNTKQLSTDNKILNNNSTTTTKNQKIEDIVLNDVQGNVRQEIEIEKEIDNISTTITTIGEKNIFEIIEENFGRTLNPMEYETIEKWSEYNFPFDLLKYAVSKAVLKNIYNISYIDKILYEWNKNNIRTVAQAQKSDEEHEKNKQQPKNNFRHYKTQREREEEAIAKFLSEPDD